MYDSIRSGSTRPLLSRMTDDWSAKKGLWASPLVAFTGPPSRPATMEAASSGVTFW